MKFFTFLRRILLWDVVCATALFVGVAIAHNCLWLQPFYRFLFNSAEWCGLLNIFTIAPENVFLALALGWCLFGILALPWVCLGMVTCQIHKCFKREPQPLAQDCPVSAEDAIAGNPQKK